MNLDEVRTLLGSLTDEERKDVLRALRVDHGVLIHPLEAEWNTTAEAILEAIHSAPDLTQRGVRGILAEATFRTTVVPSQLPHWQSIGLAGDLPYDLLMDDGRGEVKVQVKLQRRERGTPKVDARLTTDPSCPVFVVETQRTRNGQATGADGATAATRPYRFGEFDVLAVCLQPSTGKWTDYIYCPARSLLPRSENPALMKVMQPIFTDGSRGWTHDFDAAAEAARKHAAGG